LKRPLFIIIVSVLMLSLIVLPSQSAFGWGGGGQKDSYQIMNLSKELSIW